MADDILLTPEEQDEKARKWFKENGLSLAIGIALGLGAIFGYNQYKAKIQVDAENASSLYNSVLQQISDSSIVDISEDIEALKTDYADSPYTVKAVMINAARLADTDMESAIQEYKWAFDNAEELGVQHAARIRQAKLYIATDDLQSASDLASQQPYDNFASHYYEILGDVAVKQAQLDQAYEYYQQASEQLLPSDASYASVLGLKMAPLPKPASEDSISTEAQTTE